MRVRWVRRAWVPGGVGARGVVICLPNGGVMRVVQEARLDNKCGAERVD